MKRCPKCKRLLLVSDFHKDRSKKSSVRSWCKSCSSKARRAYIKNNRKRLSVMRKKRPSRQPENVAQKRQELKMAVFNHYGGPKCSCCGETEFLFLCIDHIGGNGGKHLREIGYNLYCWLKRNNYPTGFQVLCFNCNRGKHFNKGVCPHIAAALAAGDE